MSIIFSYNFNVHIIHKCGLVCHSVLHVNDLFSADDSFKDCMDTNAIVSASGHVLWMFPAVVKTYCTLDVQHFPFDRQNCSIVFISWTFNGLRLNVTYNPQEQQVRVPSLGMFLVRLFRLHVCLYVCLCICLCLGLPTQLSDCLESWTSDIFISNEG